MVCSQSPKGVALAIWTGWDDVADLDLAVGDDHAVDEMGYPGQHACGGFLAIAA